VLGEIKHVLGDFDVLDIVEILRLAAHFVRVAQQRADEAFVKRFEGDDVLAVGEHDPADRDLVHLANGLADHREGVVADLTVRTQIIGTDQVARIDLRFVHELVDVDRAGGFQGDVLGLFLADLDEGLLVERIAPLTMSSWALPRLCRRRPLRI
jgi:hypothetical protein